MQNKCSECDSVSHAHKLCTKHYAQLRRRGSVIKYSKRDRNDYEIVGDDGYILTKNSDGVILNRIIVDKIAIPILLRYKWCVDEYGYAITDMPGQGKMRMHRFVMVYNGPLFVDHINGNRIDNRKQNLRIATSAENQMNRRSTKGYCYHQKRKKWKAHIRANGVEYVLGWFKTEEEAKQAREKGEVIHFGNFRNKNKVV